MIYTYTDKPKGRLPLARGHNESENVFNFGNLDLPEYIKNPYHSLHISQHIRRAIENPNTRIIRYFEENGYEYCDWAEYKPYDNTVHTNDIRCPRYFAHHLGSTCSMCGLKD